MTAAAHKRILIVDDNVAFAASLAGLLKSWGHETLFVHDGQGAIRVARYFLPDVVLLDIGLPGLDGFQVGQALRREPALHSALILSMSAVVQPGDAGGMLAAGIDRHLMKPLDMRFLQSLLGGHA